MSRYGQLSPASAWLSYVGALAVKFVFLSPGLRRYWIAINGPGLCNNSQFLNSTVVCARSTSAARHCFATHAFVSVSNMRSRLAGPEDLSPSDTLSPKTYKGSNH
jgi:hypothetical protein